MTGRFYDRLHESYFPITSVQGTRIGQKRLERCLSIIRESGPRNVLEVGFENPDLSKLIAELPGVKYVGVDISKVSVQAARKIGLSAVIVDISRDKLPFEDRAFDLVYAAEVIEHLLDPDFAMEEFTRVLRPNGKVLMTTPNLASWYNRIFLPLGLQPIHTEVSTRRILGRKFSLLGQGNRPVGHLRLFTLRSLVDFLNLHGLRVLALEGYPLELSSELTFVESVLAKFTSLASGFIALCEKR